jgi:competence protein ComEA
MKGMIRIPSILVVLLLVFAMAGTATAGDALKININTAPVEELVKLKMIGPSYAARIVAYREKNGPFQRPEDIMKVSGIGPRTFEEIRSLITVE